MINHSLLMAAISKFKDKRIMCIGDVMLDRYVYGEVKRVSPEAPIPVLSTSHENMCIGAAGNVARNIASLGAVVEFHSAVGDDNHGTQLQKLLGKEDNIECYLHVHNTKTTVKTRYISQGQQIVRVDEEDIFYHGTAPDDISHDIDALIISDYQKGMIDLKDINFIIKDARSKAIPVIVDSKSDDFKGFRGATVITPNLGELAAAVDGFPQDGDDNNVVEAAQSVIACDGIENVLVTRASRGMTLQTKGNRTVHIPAVAKEVYDVVGAGDTVAAVIALGLSTGLDIYHSAYLANIAGGIVVGKRGTAVVTPMELKTALVEIMDKPLKEQMDYSNMADRVPSELIMGLGIVADA